MSKSMPKYEKYEVGDRVLIVDKWNKSCLSCVDNYGHMDRYLGTTMTIIRVIWSETFHYWVYKMKEDFGNWYWHAPMIAGRPCFRVTIPAGEVLAAELKELYKYNLAPDHIVARIEV